MTKQNKAKTQPIQSPTIVLTYFWFPALPAIFFEPFFYPTHVDASPVHTPVPAFARKTPRAEDAAPRSMGAEALDGLSKGQGFHGALAPHLRHRPLGRRRSRAITRAPCMHRVVARRARTNGDAAGDAARRRKTATARTATCDTSETCGRWKGGWWDPWSDSCNEKP